jgi:hypothetical protein
MEINAPAKITPRPIFRTVPLTPSFNEFVSLDELVLRRLIRIIFYTVSNKPSQVEYGRQSSATREAGSIVVVTRYLPFFASLSLLKNKFDQSL